MAMDLGDDNSNGEKHRNLRGEQEFALSWDVRTKETLRICGTR